ncbi:type IV pilus biogenesis protein PilP [Salmonella enterica subsp. enterica serovar Bredeney]|nr:type IV pilus biogenesis protein PilP [Salmonella enterica subsp. enterica serovar Bredeney]EBY2600015.1 type IV pilus biogenesis protein PilP [Salmonella enterica subsp. enterica serovar Bredeney]EEM9512970.1 type IV pilus biogenesis protein PilP [Salmonella enterica]
MHRSNILLIPLAVFALFARPSFAGPDRPVVTDGELEDLQNRNILLEARVRGAQLEKQLEEAAGGSLPAAVSPGAPAGTSVTAQAAHRQTQGHPVVLEISGRDKKLQAILRLADGRQTTVRAGSPLPGTTLTVKSVTPAGVTLSDGTHLTF